LAVGTQADVLRKIHLTNQMEIKAGQLAEEKGFSVKVRDYGKRLVKDHTQADREVQAAAKREKIDLSAPIPEVDEAMGATELNLMNKLQAANGADFDRVFAESMDSAHQEAIRSLQTAQKQYQGTETAKVIGQILPKLEKHERIAEKIEQRAE
jgi:putative membrane protein